MAPEKKSRSSYLFLWTGIAIGVLPIVIWPLLPFLVRFYPVDALTFMYERLFQRGIIPHVTMILYTVGIVKLILCVFRIKREEEAVEKSYVFLQGEGRQYLEIDTIAGFLEELKDKIADKYRNTLTVQRIIRGLERLSNTKSLSDTERLMDETARAHWDKIESEYGLVRFTAGVIPILGFLGTVYGISVAIVEMGKGITSFDKIMSVLPLMTHSLGIAFDTTLIALFCSGLLLFVTHIVRSREESVLMLSQDYLLESFLPKVRVMGDEAMRAVLQETVVWAINDEINLIELLRDDLKGILNTLSSLERLKDIQKALAELFRLQEDVPRVLRGLQGNVHDLAETLEGLSMALGSLKPAIKGIMPPGIAEDINHAMHNLLKAVVVAKGLDRLTKDEQEHYRNIRIDDLGIFDQSGEGK